MTSFAAPHLDLIRLSDVRTELVCWAAGLAFTFVLFFGLAHVENGVGAQPATIEDAPVLALPFEPPPPPVERPEVATTAQEPLPLASLDIEASDSPVKIAVPPPDLTSLASTAELPPSGTLAAGRLYSEFRPRVELQVDVKRVYQQAEVDQPPRALVRVVPTIPGELFGKSSSLAVTLLLVINANGRAESARVFKSSGAAAFDQIVARTVQEDWVFSPAIKRGRKVRCLAQQNFRIVLSGGSSPFTVE